MQWVAVARERAEMQPAGGDRVLKPLPCCIVLEQCRRIRMLRSGISPDPDLNRFASRGLDVVQRLLERALAEQHCEDSDLHGWILSLCLSPLAGPAHAGP